MCKNATTPIIVILGCSEIDTEILSTDMETVKSSDCRKVLRDDGDTNEVLAIIQEKARFSYKYGQKFIDLFTQSISRLC